MQPVDQVLAYSVSCCFLRQNLFFIVVPPLKYLHKKVMVTILYRSLFHTPFTVFSVEPMTPVRDVRPVKALHVWMRIKVF